MTTANPSFPTAPPQSDEIELTVVMPCLNEEKTVGICVEKAVCTFKQCEIAGEVVVVDNGSNDHSVEIAERSGARVVHHSLKGYGNALLKGFEEARGKFIIMGDADDSYDFTDLMRFLIPLRNGADLVMGNRFTGEIKPGAMPWLHKNVGNPLLTRLLNLFYQTGVGDCHCGMRGLSKSAYRRMNLRMPGMELASEMVIKSATAKLRIEEIPITLHKDGRGRRPHLRSFRDGWRHLRFMLMCTPLWLFFIPGAIMIVASLVAIPVAAITGHGVYTGSFGPNFLYTASLAAIGGFHLIVFGILAKMYAHQVDPVFNDPRVDRWTRWFTVERGLGIGLGLIAVGLALATPVIYEWLKTEMVSSVAEWVSAATFILLGFELMFLSFLIGIIDLGNETQRTG